MILDADIPREDLSSLRVLTTGAAPLDPAIITEFLQRYGIPVLQAYGATEFSGAVAGWTLDSFTQHSHRKAASVGQFHPGVTGRIVDPDTGEVLATGEEGILEMKAAQFGNGGAWLRTTDRALLDEDGFLYIKGRSDSAIIRGGFKVHPDEVAAVLKEHPAVRDAVVVGIKHDRLGEVPVAAVTLKSGVVAPTIRELTDFAKEKLLPYQVPSALLIVDDVPRTSSMKPALDQVRELFREQIP